MSRQHFFQANDPVHVGEERFIGVYFVVTNPGCSPHGHGEHFDPGNGPEFEIVSSQDDAGRVVELTDAQLAVVEAEIFDEFDFRAAEREERQQDADLYRDEDLF